MKWFGSVHPREAGDVFDLKGVPAFRDFYRDGILVWKQLYRGAYAPWHRVAAPTIENPGASRELFRMNAAKALCAELAGLVWGEQCAIRVGTPDGDGALDGFVASVLAENGFQGRMQQLLEQALALGGGAVKVWVEPGETGNAVAVRLGYVSADQFVPLGWDEGGVGEGVFISRVAKDGESYTRLEWHRREGGHRVIENALYRSRENRDALGERAPLQALYRSLSERVELPPGAPLFAYFRTASANNLADDCPLGVSVFGNALETLHALDICYDSLVSEFRLGRKRIIVPARCVRQVVDPVSGVPRRYFDPRDEVYDAFAGDDRDELHVQDDSVSLRVEEHVAALNAFLGVLCLQTGFSVGSFSFDNRAGIRTATEVVSENSKTFKTVRTVQNQLAPALERMVRAIVELAALFGIEYRGRPVAELAARGFEVKVTFDDGAVQDRASCVDEGIRLVRAGLLSRFSFLTNPRFGQGLTESEARAELGRMESEAGKGEEKKPRRTRKKDEERGKGARPLPAFAPQALQMPPSPEGEGLEIAAEATATKP